MTKAELQKAFLHRLPVIYTPVDGDPIKYQYIEAIEYSTDRFGVFKLGVILHDKRNSITHVFADRVEIEDKKERENANTRPCPFKMPSNFNKFKTAFIKCCPVKVKGDKKDRFYPRITKLTVMLDYYGDIIFTITVGKNRDSKVYLPEEVFITNYKDLIGAKNDSKKSDRCL